MRRRVVPEGEGEGREAQVRVDICYVAPCGRRMRTFPELQRYLENNKMADLTLENFTFSKKVAIGEEVDVAQVRGVVFEGIYYNVPVLYFSVYMHDVM